MSSTHLDVDVNHAHDDSFDSLPPGEKYHSPPFELEDDPFDTSAIIIPESTNVSKPQPHPQRPQPHEEPRHNGGEMPNAYYHEDLYAKIKSESYHQQQPSMLAQLLSSKEGSHITASGSTTLTSYSAALNTSNNSTRQHDKSRADVSYDFETSAKLSFADADAMLPQLTSPLSPPAFNPADIILGSNEAIAGLESPALNMALPKSSLFRRNDDAFNWLESTMTDLKIGKKDAVSQQQQQQVVTRNANVFQFPPPQMSAASSSVSVTQTDITLNQSKVTPPMNSINSQRSVRVERNSIAVMPTVSSQTAPSMTSSKSTTFTSPPSYAPPPAINPSQIRPHYDQPNQAQQQQSSQSFLSWPVRPQMSASNYQQMVPMQAAVNHRPVMLTPAPAGMSPNSSMLTPVPTSNSPRPATISTMASSMPFMAPHMMAPTNLNAFRPSQTPPPAFQNSFPVVQRPTQMSTILQPQKVSKSPSQQQQQDQARQSKMFDKEFILELEKNLGLREATANLMPPSPAPSMDQTHRPILVLEPNMPGSIPALRPPPQSTLRNNARRNTTAVSLSTLAEASSIYQQQQHQHQQQQRRESSLPRPTQNLNSSSPQVGYLNTLHRNLSSCLAVHLKN